MVRKKEKRSFERFLSHDNPRVKECVEQLLRHDAERREAWRRERRAEEEAEERWLRVMESGVDVALENSNGAYDRPVDDADFDIPF